MTNEEFETKRLTLQTTLENLLGKPYVYYQPPESIKLKYPCIIYSSDPDYTTSADNYTYIAVNKFHVKHIYKSYMQSLTNDLRAAFQMISHDNRMVADSMYNDDYTLYL